MSKKAVPKHFFTSHDDDDDDEDEDDIVFSPKPSKPIKQHPKESKQNLNDSHGNKSLKSSHERDSFLNAFLDRDVNSKHEPLQLKSRHEGTDKDNTPAPKPRPRKTDPVHEPSSDQKPSFRPPPQFQLGSKEESYSVGNKSSFDFDSTIKQSVDQYSSGKDDSMKVRDSHDNGKGFKPFKSAKQHSSYDHNDKLKGKPQEQPAKSAQIPQSAQSLIDSIEKYKTQSKDFDTPTKQERPTKPPHTPQSTQELLDSMEKYKKQSQVVDEKGRPVKQERPTKSPRMPQSAQDLIAPIEKYKSQSKDLDGIANKPIKQERPTKSPRNQQKPDPNTTSKHHEADEINQPRERPTKSPRAPQSSKDSIDKYSREKSFERDKPIKQERPTKSPRPTQPVSKEISSKNREPIKSERPTKSPRPTKAASQTVENRENITSKSQDRSDDKYNKNLSKFDDLLRNGARESKGSKEPSYEKTKPPRDGGSDHRHQKQQEEVDDLFNIGGRNSSLKSSLKGEKIERTKNLEQEGKESKFDRSMKSKDYDDYDDYEQLSQNTKARDYKEGNKALNKNQEKSFTRKQGLSRQEHFDHESRQKLRDAVEKEQPKSKRIPDEQIDSLFDAGSKRTASVRKERVKCDKLKEHVQRSNESLHRTMDDESEERKNENVKRKEDKSRDSTPQKKKGPMKANLPIEEATKSPITKTKASKNRPLSSTHRIKSSSLTNISNLISPRLQSPITYDDVSSMDGQTLRNQIYTDWLQRKRSFTKDESKVRKEKEAKEKENEERMAHERRVDAKKSFEAWGSKKEETLKSKRREMKHKEQAVREKEDENLQKTKEASKFFESWKQQKDEVIKSKKSKTKREENEKKKREVSDKIEKTEDAKKVFENWRARKDEQIKEQEREKRKQKKKEEKNANLDEVEKKQTAQRSYEAWKERKVKSRPASANALQQRPWCPSSRQRGDGIPSTVNPVVLRNKPPSPRTRTLSATSRLQNTGKRSK